MKEGSRGGRDSRSGRLVLPIPQPAPDPAEALDIRQEGVREPIARVEPPAEAPNVLLILLDDMGFGAPSPFGGPISMPAAERLAEEGLRYSRFHTTAICAPTRASLLTGRNSHAVGMGNVPELATSSPGSTAHRPKSAATMAEVLKHNGYSTAAFGKMHQTPLPEVSPAGPFDRWPTNEGFEKFYGFVGGETNQFYPTLHSGTTPIEPPATPEDGYHLSEDLVDQSIGWVEEQTVLNPGRPFFCYLSFGATHAPLHVPESWRGRNRGRYALGWDQLREVTLARQKELGLVPADAVLPAWPEEAPHWDDLTSEERESAERLMELYADFTEHTDAQVGRLVEALERLGVRDDTLIIYILGDNGASAEGGIHGSTNEFIGHNGMEDSPARVLELGERLGGPDSNPHYPSSWALSLNTPYQWAKQVASHYGGTRNPLIVSWPSGIRSRGQVRNQWHHVNDVLPTVLEAAGLPAPQFVDGVAQTPFAGVSMTYSFDDGEAADRHTTQYFEVFGNRGIFHKGWVACARHRTPWKMSAEVGPVENDRWELYDTSRDWTQAEDLAAEMPEKLAELQKLFLVEAARNQVLPIDDRVLERFLPDVAGRSGPATDLTDMTYPGNLADLQENAVINVRNRSHRITAEVEVTEAGASGVVVAQGSRFGGWSLYLQEGRAAYCGNCVGMHLSFVQSQVELRPGPHTLVMEFNYDGGGQGLGGDVVIRLDGDQVGAGRVTHTTPFTYGPGTLFSIGRDAGSTVCDRYPIGDGNRFPGSVASVRVELLGEQAPNQVAGEVRAALASH